MPNISLIVPVYNSEKYLEDCVNSLINQSYKDIEILLIDDGSKDRSPIICDRLSDKDNRIRVIHKEQAGVSAARNLGIAEAKGKYLQFVDSDDLLEPDYTERLIKEAEARGRDLVISGYKIDKANTVINVKPPIFSVSNVGELEPFFSELYPNNFFNSIWNKLYLKSRITVLFDEAMCLGEDFKFNIDNIRNFRSISSIDSCGYIYYIREKNNSLTARYNPQGVDISIELYEGILSFCRESFGENFKSEAPGYVLYISIRKHLKDIMENTLLTRAEKLSNIKKIIDYECIKQLKDNKSVNTTLFSRILVLLLVRRKALMTYLLLRCKGMLVK